MKETAVVACLLAELSLAAFVLASEGAAHCPALCRCEIRPWFSPSSVYTEAATVDCNDLGLSALPERLPSDTQVLLLQTNNIVNVQKTLDYLANITEIDLSQNNISSVSDVCLGFLPQLLSLHMEENWIQELSDSCLVSLPNLQEFYINHNLIFSISPGAFHGLRRLLRLHLNSNRLTSINSQWFQQLPNLEILMLGENPILQLSDMNFKPLANLRSLVLARMNLTEIPDNTLVGLDNLESISFFDNLLSRVPRAALTKVQNLKFLDLNKNPIERIKKGDFMDMMHLKELGINSMPELISIDSFALNNLPELTKIEATNNPRLSYIHPKAFHKLPRLETLMLNSNSLSALHCSTVESLPNLREVSLHSNPIRCDCIIRWVNMNRTAVRFMEPDSLFCVEPPEYQGQHVRQVHFREMTEICLPLISPGSLPGRVEVAKGRSVSLHCRAYGEPEPEIYWVTPSGDQVLHGSVYDKYYMHPEGTLDIYDASEQEAGSYTCIAHNLVGADLKSVSVVVDGYIALSSTQPLHVLITSVQSHTVMVSWESTGALVSQLNWSIVSEDSSLLMPFTARLPAGVKGYHIKQLKPSTRYQVCVEVTAAQPGNSRDCVNVTTKEAAVLRETTKNWDSLVMASCAVLFIVVAVACSVMYTSLYSQVFYRKLIADPAETLLIASTPSSSSSSSSLLEFGLYGVKVRATVIDLPDDSM
ncbi:leucine-rich repeat neuronal protein 3 [Hippoglossus hippoglossus]|uniref:leucine-rich repeat neuronal protein 3 n=1 Tax=Hippoglossus hippoglossus TaxID=8267 RepID=UPI00148D69C3|nr:leucine-rich repeat neuronal protein 3 [Hippoglossus hippoglossus]XP_035012813.1 leucine-rich repeat neuronal protein 3 [Hippoglossus stenolepis]